MIVQARELLLKVVILAGLAMLFGLIGFITPTFFDQDVAGAFAAGVLGIIGLIFGMVVAIFVIRRNFD